MKISHKYKLQDKLIYYSIFLLFFLEPLFLDTKLHSQEIGKALILRITTIIALTGWLIKAYKSKSLKIAGSWLDYLAISLLFLSLISTIFGYNPKLSVMGCYNRYEGILTFTNYIILYFIGSTLFKNKRMIINLLKVILFSFIISGTYGLFQYFGYDPLEWQGAIRFRAHSTFGNPVFFGAYLCIILPMGLYLYLYHKPKLLFGLLTFFIYLLLIFTQTRGAILGGFISIVFFFIFLRKKFPLLKADLIRLAVPIVIATICINLHPKTSFIKRFTKEIIKIPASEEISTKKQEIQSISDDISLVKPKKEYQLVGGAAGRIEIWKTTLAIIKDYPLLGIGPENLEVLFPYYKTIEYVRSSSDYNRSNRAHNQILEFFMTRGILGGLIYLAILATLFYFGIRLIIKGEKLGIPILCTQIAYIVQNLFGFGTLSISSIFWLSAGILNNLYSTQYSDKNRIYPIHNWLLPSLFTMVILGISFLWLFQTIKDYAIDRTFQIAEIYRNSGYKKECLPLYKKVLAKQSYERRYYEPLIDRYLEESPEKAIKLLKKALSFIKDDYVYYFYLGLAYDKLKNTKKAEDSYKKAIKNCRYFGDAFHNLGDLYRRNNRFKEALIYLRKAYEIDPKRPEYIDSLAGLYLSLGNEKKALQLYKTLTEVAPSYPHILKVHKQLRGLYYKFGKIKETIRECEEILKLAPHDIETLWGLATLYYNTKRLKKAEVLCHKILKLHPNYQQAIRMLLFIKKNKA